MTTMYTSLVTSSIDLDYNDMFQHFVVDCSSGNINIDMTSLIYTGYYFIFNRIDTSSNTLTLTARSGQTINGTTTYNVPIKGYTECVGLSTDWLCTTFTHA